MATRLQEKLLHAANAVQRQYTKIEARADALIEREKLLEEQTHAAFAPHEALLSQAEQGLTDVSKQLEVMTRGQNDPNPLQDISTPHADHSIVTDVNGKVLS